MSTLGKNVYFVGAVHGNEVVVVNAKYLTFKVLTVQQCMGKPILGVTSSGIYPVDVKQLYMQLKLTGYDLYWRVTDTFATDTSFDTLFIPAVVKKLTSDASYYDREYVYIQDGVECIEPKCFYDGRLRGIRLPNTIQYIGDKAFAYNANLYVTNYNNVAKNAYKGNDLFLGDYNLTCYWADDIKCILKER